MIKKTVGPLIKQDEELANVDAVKDVKRVHVVAENTLYMIEETPTFGFLKIVRKNSSGGNAMLLVPRELITGFAREIAKSQLDAILMKVLG